MGTDSGLARVLAFLCLLGVLPEATSGQAPLFLVNGETTVSSVKIHVTGGGPFPESQLRKRIALRGPPALAGVRSALSWLPLVSKPQPVPFDPISLQKDVVRLRRFFRSSGFPRAEVDYRVALDTLQNQVDLRLEVRPGPARILESVVVSPSEGDTTGMALGRLSASLNEHRGERIGEMEVLHLRDRVVAWVSERGRAFPQTGVELFLSEDSLSARLRIELDPGPVATVGAVHIQEEGRLSRGTVERQLLFQPGEPFSSRRVSESAMQLLDLDLVQVALVELEPDQPRDEDADLRIRITEGSPRLVSGRLGYADQRGLIAEAGWSHRDFLGGARTFRVSSLAETGIWSIGDLTQERYGGSVSLEQPWLFDARVSLLSDLSADYTDGPRATARTVGTNVTAVYERGPHRFVSLRYGVSVRDVVDSRGGGGTGELGVVEFLRRLEDVEGSIGKTALALSASWGRRDDLTAPSRGWITSGGLELVGFDGWSDVQYVRLDLSASTLRPLTDGGPRLLARARAGRVLPWGRSEPGDDPLLSYLRLGDAVFTEGGTGQVRGWAEGALGPKLPDLEIVPSGDTVTARPTGRYAPLGGLARVGGSLELQLPLPLLDGEHFALLFVDGARVWTPDGDYLGEGGIPALASDDRARFGAGAGLSFDSPVGPIRIMLGYKLNPSPLDVRSAEAVGTALLEGRSPSEVSENPWRRLQLHLAIGQVF